MFTPNRTYTPVSSSSGRRRTGGYSFSLTPRRNQGVASPLSSRRPNFYARSSAADASSIGSPSVSSAYYNTENYSIETSSSSLPVLVNEALTLGGRNAEISAEFNENGWAWLICDRKLFVWRFKQSASKHLCKEFTLNSLGPTESQYKAGLIWVGKGRNSRDEGIVSLLVVSPSGNVKFWPNIVQSVTSSTETNLDGIAANSPDEECLKVLMTKDQGYIVVTTNGSFLHLQPSSNSIAYRRLQMSQGMLAGIGRRVSSFFFSSVQGVDVVNLVMLQTSSRSPHEVVMLTTSAMQKWQLASIGASNGNDHMTAQADINDLLSGPVSQALGNSAHKDYKIWPLDIAVCSKNNHLAVLIALKEVLSANLSSLRLCVCVCPSSVLKEGQDVATANLQIEVFVLDHKEMMRDEDSCQTFSYQLLIQNSSGAVAEQAIIWRSDKVILKSLSKALPPHEDSPPLESLGDTILGVGKYNNQGMLLASSSGLLSVSPVVSSRSLVSQNIEDSILQTSSSSLPQTPISSLPNTPVVSKAKIEHLESSEHGAQRLQAAFIHFNRMNITHARAIVDEAFGEADGKKSLDDAVVFVSQELINDYPAQDPRWAESVPQDSGNASTSLILQHQLQDKQKAHQLFLDFLIEVDIWNNLGISVDGKTKHKSSTQWLLVEHGEKLSAAIALRQKHLEHQGVVDSAIRKVLERRGSISDKRGLTPQDVFYREVSRIQDILEGLLDTEEDMISDSSFSSREIFTAIAGVNEIFEGMLSAAYQFRRSKDVVVQGKGIEFSPWTVSSGRHSLRDTIVRQHDITFSRGLSEAEDGQQRALLHSHLVALADILLYGYQQQMESIVDTSSLSARYDELMEAFKRHRTAVITAILNAGLVDKAANLAEKYNDFGILVEICDRNDDQNKLSQYMIDFAALGFSDYLFNWLLEQGKFRKLLDCTASGALAAADYNLRLSEFLSSHPNIAWLHQIKIGEFMSAQKTLQYLAEMETENASKKNHFLSLSKLSAVFSNDPEGVIEDRVNEINSQQMLLKHQETLPNAVLEKLGVTLDSMPVFSVHKLIELYAGEDNTESNEVDFKKALDLLQFIPENFEDPERRDDEVISVVSDVEDMKQFIWCQAILKDNWSDINHGSDALKACGHTILSKTLSLVREAGVLAECLPNVEKLLKQEALGTISRCASSQYLIRAKFEQFERQLLMS